MVPSVDNATIIQFSDRVHVAAQQNKARLRPYTFIKQIKGERFAYDGIGPVEAREVSGRNQPVVFSDINHNRRLLRRRRFTIALPIDSADVRSILLSPDSEYAAACVRAMERVYDRVSVEAMFVDVWTGVDFATAVTFAADGGRTINATAGTTYEKLLESDRNFMDDDVGTDIPEKMVMGVTGDEHEDLMQELELVNADYTRRSVVDGGRITKAMGYDIVPFAANANLPILSVSGGTRDCFAMSSRAICVGMSKMFEVSIEKRPDLIETRQVSVVFDFGAVRTEGKLIQKFQTTD